MYTTFFWEGRSETSIGGHYSLGSIDLKVKTKIVYDYYFHICR